MRRLEDSRAYAVIVVAGIVLAISPFLPWAKAYGETDVSLVRVANASQDQRFVPWLLVGYGIVVAIGVRRRSVQSYVVILVTSALMLLEAFYGVFSAEDQAYSSDTQALFGAWVGFGALGLIALTSLVALLRL